MFDADVLRARARFMSFYLMYFFTTLMMKKALKTGKNKPEC